MKHELKILNEYLIPILEGKKTFEVRKNDRNYKVGDTIVFPGTPLESEKQLQITYILTDKEFPAGIKEGYCIIAFKEISMRIADT